MDHSTRVQFDHEKGEKRTEEKVGYWEKVAYPDLLSMIAQEDPPVLTPWSSRPHLPHQEHATHFGACGSFDLSAQDNKRLSEERVFCHEFGLRSGEVSHGSQRERGVGWLCPVDEAVLERLKADAYQCPDEGEKTMHGVQYPF